MSKKNKNSLAMRSLDQIPEHTMNAEKITALVKKSGRTVGYQLSDNRILTKEEGVALAKEGGIQGVGIAHRNDKEYLKSLPDDTENNNLSNLPSISQ